ncbi:hypothetical protein [Geotalea sp. SG265]|uniref:hypothetical protein n=1 Tax=Geotalea sp. SG265 TaxID=2922867 RepID=UPI001FB01F45|nr:hypothetical protein [Geotalea sp. SG265]
MEKKLLKAIIVAPLASPVVTAIVSLIFDVYYLVATGDRSLDDALGSITLLLPMSYAFTVPSIVVAYPILIWCKKDSTVFYQMSSIVMACGIATLFNLSAGPPLEFGLLLIFSLFGLINASAFALMMKR